MKNKNKNEILDINYIKSIQQNRFPLLFIDKIIEIKPGKYSKTIKNFSYNEWFFPSHFEDEPNVPGFIQIEILVQSFITIFLSQKKYKGMKTSFLDIVDAKFRKKIVPGDTLKVTAKLESLSKGIAKGNAKGFVDNEFACSASFIIAIPDVLNLYVPKFKKI